MGKRLSGWLSLVGRGERYPSKLRGMLPLVEPELLLRVSMLPSLCSSAGTETKRHDVNKLDHGCPRGASPPHTHTHILPLTVPVQSSVGSEHLTLFLLLFFKSSSWQAGWGLSGSGGTRVLAHQF